MPTARGAFDVTMEPEPPYLEADGVSLGRATVRKRFSGDVVGEAEAAMLAAHTPVEGSAGYVAIDRFVGSVAGRSGAFVMQHSGIMAAGDAELAVRIVPGSGTGGLEGISGTLQIDNVDGEHSYVLEYDLPG
jgi:hypothetical protein